MSTSKNSQSNDGVGCALALVAMVIGLIVAAAISVAAVVDPFDWMPGVSEIWADCEGDCDLADRFPGFWWHTVANLLYAAVTLLVAFAFAGKVGALRTARVARYASADDAAAFERAHRELVAGAGMLGALAAFPLIVAIL
jgi:hypothetical protein